jgi:hypothetical protein
MLQEKRLRQLPSAESFFAFVGVEMSLAKWRAMIVLLELIFAHSSAG